MTHCWYYQKIDFILISTITNLTKHPLNQTLGQSHSRSPKVREHSGNNLLFAVSVASEMWFLSQPED